ncbi:MAG: type II secretion system F family protein [Deltaproteobacteria bacterium]|nr:type II secretion system F family protein [Deltaproteobacteria bacterium]
MAIFEYQIIDKQGKKKKGKLDAPNLKQATTKLQAQDQYILSISSVKEKPSGKNDFQLFKKKSVPSQIITSFTRQLSILVSTGIPYDKAFDILIQECEHPHFQDILSGMKSLIVEGSSLASALESKPDYFPKMFVAMVKAGETGGTLDNVLNELTSYREEQESLKSKIQSALIYPIIMTLLGLFIVVFMITFILPKIVPIFRQFEVALPLPTQIVMFLSDTMVAYWWILVLLIAGVTFWFVRFKKTPMGEKAVDFTLLKMPILGSVMKKVIIYRFTQTLGTMLSSGVELKFSLDVVRHVMGNRVYDDTFDQVIADITKKGMDLSQALRKTELFPSSVIQMIRVGEESSKMEVMLAKVAKILDKEVKQTIEKSVALLEPLLIIWMAVMVGFIVMAVLLPMFKMNQLI